MAYIGPLPAETFTSFATQEFSTSATTSYTLDHAVTNENEIALFINNVRQQPGSGKAYTATGTALTLSAATASTDTMYAVFLGRALQTVNPADASVGTSQLAATSVTAAKLNNDIISGQTALAETPADTDELLLSDGGTIKRIDFSYIKSTPTHTLLSETNITSSVSEVDIPSVFTDTYRDYLIVCSAIHPQTDRTNFRIRYYNSSGLVTGSSYAYVEIARADDSATPNTQSSSDTEIRIFNNRGVGNGSQEAFNVKGTLFNPRNTAHYKNFSYLATNFNNYDSNRNVHSTGSGIYEATDALVGIKFFMSSGNIDTGNIKIYGIT